MHRIKSLALLMALISCDVFAQVRVICSSALVFEQLQKATERFRKSMIDDVIAERRLEYQKAITIIKNYGYTPYIAEPCIEPPTYLNDLSPHVCSTLSNNPALNNRGVAEADSLCRAFECWDFPNEDFLVKMTGRYRLKSRFFLDMAELVAPFADALVKRGNGSIFTGCFALRARYFKEFLESLDLEKMERESISIEEELYTFIQHMESRGLVVIQLDEVQVEGRMFNDGVETYNYTW